MLPHLDHLTSLTIDRDIVHLTINGNIVHLTVNGRVCHLKISEVEEIKIKQEGRLTCSTTFTNSSA